MMVDSGGASGGVVLPAMEPSRARKVAPAVIKILGIWGLGMRESGNRVRGCHMIEFCIRYDTGMDTEYRYGYKNPFCLDSGAVSEVWLILILTLTLTHSLRL